MNTVDAYGHDIRLQPDFLRSFRAPEPFPESEQRGMIFAGSGDSLASAMLAESFSEGRVRAMDPLDLYRNRRLAKSSRVCLVSVSGNTAANIRTARIARDSTAITARASGRLAKASDRTILLQAPTSGIITAGSITFLESALVCISLVRRLRIPRTGDTFDMAEADAREARLSGKIYVLGSRATYPVAMYCAAKLYEVMGYDAHYCRTEQFSHMELFSAKRGDTVIILEDDAAHGRQLAEELAGAGMNVIRPKIPSGQIPQLLYCIFFSQMVSLFEAKRKRRMDCHFVTAKDLRGISDRMIY